jgi:Amidohydrolase
VSAPGRPAFTRRIPAAPIAFVVGKQRLRELGFFLLTLTACWLAWIPSGLAADLPLFDAHIHYSPDAWEAVPAEEAVRRLEAAGTMRAFVSSSGNDGTWQLHRLAPDRIIPALRPYRTSGGHWGWVRDESVIPYLESELKNRRYVAIGELHIEGAQADTPVMRRVVELAREHDLFLHVHGDPESVDGIFSQYPRVRIVWAHAGFVAPGRVRQMMERYATLWADLSFRNDVAPSAGGLDPSWREVLLAFPDRFMVGADTYTAERWGEIESHAAWARRWLGELPADVAERIAWRNGEALLTKAWKAKQNP